MSLVHNCKSAPCHVCGSEDGSGNPLPCPAGVHPDMSNIQTTVTYRILPDLDPDTSYLDQPEFSDRKAEYEADAFSFIGIRAEVHRHDWSAGTHETYTSAGLWGIESDSDTDYLRSVGADELSQLRDRLASAGVDIAGIEPVLE